MLGFPLSFPFPAKIKRATIYTDFPTANKNFIGKGKAT